MPAVNDQAPSFTLPDIDTGAPVSDPWRASAGPTVLAFFKATCPVCQMAAPAVRAMAEAGAAVVAIGEDPAPKLVAYRDQWGQTVPTLTEPAPYRVSGAYGLVSVPTLYLVGAEGTILDMVRGWDRDGWNAVAVAAGGSPVSAPGDGLPPYRPG
jgi:peroxiredoxin